MIRRIIEEFVFPWTTLLLLASLLSLGSCTSKAPDKKTNVSTSQTAVGSQTGIEKSFDPNYTGFYINNIKEDFVESSLDELVRKHNFVVNPDVGVGEGGRKFTTLLKDGLSISAYSDTGRLLNVVLKSAGYSVEKGGHVGMSRNEVIANYPGGTYQVASGDLAKSCYLYLKTVEDGSFGVGFRFYFDRDDKVTTISIGPWSLEP